MEQTYSYSSLKEGQIRVLVLEPGSEDAPLAGNLIPVGLSELRAGADAVAAGDTSILRLEDGKPRTFEALSYVWQSSQAAAILTTSHGSLPITTSLSSSLRRLRLPDSPRVLWADAICIHQANLKEKSCQVALMGEIYGTATRVVCDLGDATDDSDLALDIMDRYWRKYLRTGIATSEYSVFKGEDSADMLGLPLLTAEEAAAIQDVPDPESPGLIAVRSFHKRPWFGRLWVVQEFILARSVVMMCGKREIPWQQVLAAFLPYQGRGFPFSDPSKSLEDILTGFLKFILMGLMRLDRTLPSGTPGRRRLDHYIHHFSNGQISNWSSLSFALLSFTSSETAVERDRYFAVLSMTDSAKEPCLFPDYQSPIEEIILRYGRYLMEKSTMREEMLLCTGLPGRIRKHPSWIRDFTTGNLWDSLWLIGPLSTISYCAAGKTQWWQKLDDKDPNLLYIIGYKLDTITRREESTRRNKALSSDDMIPHLRNQLQFFLAGHHTRTFHHAETDGRYPATGETLVDALWQTVTSASARDWDDALMKRASDGYDVAQLFVLGTEMGRGLQAVLDAFARQRGLEGDGEPLALFSELGGLLMRTWGMAYAVTARGYFGVVETASEVGDEVWVLKGLRIPVVLRPSRTRPGMYEMVAGCYVHGFMYGAALERPDFKWRAITLH
ncbi:uncharacterized protein E0L32_006141 [Thyridium curvatum]|uniref:Heterokaryon incompatibility domain-containing protein n=1 Tax=Thyridium curvatum TaxID=1093900 RepID=A0A507B8L9_9PEZI|nr:uncharacterized protein E0L32_006141 [Thyridium curvatum]TPX13411.1 hypothetical protein E0L32_006141 [Thyridium curvatum]